jgi:hypothetical protein
MDHRHKPMIALYPADSIFGNSTGDDRNIGPNRKPSVWIDVGRIPYGGRREITESNEVSG